MDIFKNLEKQINKGILAAQAATAGAIIANRGWGKRADAKLQELLSGLTEREDDVRDLLADFEGSFDDFLATVADLINNHIDNKYHPSEDEQTASYEEEDVPAPSAENVEEFLKTFQEEEAPASEEKVSTEKVERKDALEESLTAEYVAECSAKGNYEKLVNIVDQIVARLETAIAEEETAEEARLTALLAEAGISIIARGERIMWQIIGN